MRNTTFTTTLYANKLGMIPSTEVAFGLRLAAERQRRAEQRRLEKQARAVRRREIWTRVRAGLAGTGREFWARVRAGVAGTRRASARV